MNPQLLILTAKSLFTDDKGLLAMDESNPTCNKRFAALGIPQTEEAHVSAAQDALRHRAECNRAARRGEYNDTMESTAHPAVSLR